mmetsp:Transcript_57404/g.120053  ORF Transcript_57404/g.120053 Transcript_57404/m.120053 type:complete len:268 (-) Transcript_57404:23-826(-)
MVRPSVILLFVIGMGMSSSVLARSRWQSPDCDSCRTVVEQFYKGWEVTIAGLAANGTYEDQVGKAPKIVYNQHIEDFLQGFCDSQWMKGYSDYIGDGCKRIMKEHHRPIVGKFLHEEERLGTTGRRTTRPQRIQAICKDLVKVCPQYPSAKNQVTSRKDRCQACRGVVSDALYILRRSKLGALQPTGLRKKRMELYEMLDNMCPEMYFRHSDEPEVYDDVCQEMWEDEDTILGELTRRASDSETTGRLCSESFSYCSADAGKDKEDL